MKEPPHERGDATIYLSRYSLATALLVEGLAMLWLLVTGVDVQHSLRIDVGVTFTYLDTHFSWGAWGIVRALVFTALMLSISALLTKMKLRLQL